MRDIFNSKKGQTWSVDLIVGVVIFLLIVVAVYTLITNNKEDDSELRIQNEQVVAGFDKKNNNSIGVPGIIDGENLNLNELLNLYSNSDNYSDFKEKLGIKSDFCIFILDDTGGIIEFDNGFGGANMSFGNKNDNLTIANGKLCGD